MRSRNAPPHATLRGSTVSRLPLFRTRGESGDHQGISRDYTIKPHLCTIMFRYVQEIPPKGVLPLPSGRGKRGVLRETGQKTRRRPAPEERFGTVAFFPDTSSFLLINHSCLQGEIVYVRRVPLIPSVAAGGVSVAAGGA